MTAAASLADVLHAGPVIAVVTIERSEDALPTAAALCDGGVRVIEIALRSAAAIDAIAAIAAREPRALVGAGTVRHARQLDDAVAAGARFAVSPGFTPALAQAAAARGAAWLPGVATPSEVLAANEAGLTALKLFPAEPGGLERLAAFAAVFPDVAFCPTGGITAQNAPGYLALPNVPCVGGSWLTPGAALRARDWDKVAALASAAAQLRAPS